MRTREGDIFLNDLTQFDKERVDRGAKNETTSLRSRSYDKAAREAVPDNAFESCQNVGSVALLKLVKATLLAIVLTV